MKKALRALAGLALLGTLSCRSANPGANAQTPSIEAELARIPEDGGVSTTVQRARLLMALGRHDEALAALEAAEDKARERVDFRGMGALWRRRGGVLIELGRAEEALSFFRKRLETAVSLDDTQERARALVDTAHALTLLGAPSRADEAASEASLLAGDALYADPETAERAGLVAYRLRDQEKALLALARAEQGYSATGARSDANRVAVTIATIHARASGHADELTALEPRLAADPDVEARTRLLRAQAEMLFLAHDTAPCVPLAAEAVRLADRRGVVDLMKATRIVLARCAADRDDVALAARRAEEAADIVEEQRHHFVGEQAREELGFEAFQIYRMLLALEARLPEAERAPKAFVTMEKARARAHLDALMRSRLPTTAPDPAASALLASKAEIEDEVRRLTRALTEDRNAPGLAERHRNALWALDDIDDTISAQNPLLSRIAVPPAATVDDVRQKLIDEQTVLISYFFGDEKVFGVAVTKGGQRFAVVDESAEHLDRDVRAFRRSKLLDPSQSLVSVKRDAKALGDRLLKPFAKELADHPSVIFVPHGALASLPFEVLVQGDDHFLVESHEVTYALSATLAVDLAKRPVSTAKRRGFVGLGDPVYEQTTASSGPKSRGLSLWIDAAALSSEQPEAPKGMGLERIPATGDEVRAIAKLFGGDGRTYLRGEASEANVKRGILEGTRIVHIASHGILEPHYQALALSLDPASKEDGFLLHSEIAALSLDADLVVLSACQTGNTRQRAGEPVAGLSLALRGAGARRVVVSLWSVDDAATAKLMIDFYKPLVKEGQSYGKSLSAAKRAMIEKGPAHPYYWAPFVLLGP